MHSYLAYTRATRPTGKLLAHELGFTSFGIQKPRHRLDVLVRWGSRRIMPQAKLVLNRAGAISRAADKVVALEMLQAKGIATIPFFLTWEEAYTAAEGGVIFGRRRSGMGGRDIVVYEPHHREPAFVHDWFTIYREPTREVRIHVVHDRVVRIQGKYKDFPEQAARNPYVRNYEQGYRFRAPKQKLHSRRREQAIESVRALGLDFGAVDMLLFGDGAESLVLEVNTAPSCSPMTLAAYAQAIKELLPFSNL